MTITAAKIDIYGDQGTSGLANYDFSPDVLFSPQPGDLMVYMIWVARADYPGFGTQPTLTISTDGVPDGNLFGRGSGNLDTLGIVANQRNATLSALSPDFAYFMYAGVVDCDVASTWTVTASHTYTDWVVYAALIRPTAGQDLIVGTSQGFHNGAPDNSFVAAGTTHDFDMGEYTWWDGTPDLMFDGRVATDIGYDWLMLTQTLAVADNPVGVDINWDTELFQGDEYIGNMAYQGQLASGENFISGLQLFQVPTITEVATPYTFPSAHYIDLTNGQQYGVAVNVVACVSSEGAEPPEEITHQRINKRRITAKQMPYMLNNGILNRGL